VEDGDNATQEGEELAVWGSLEHEQAWLARRRALVDRFGAAPRVGMAGVVRVVDDEYPPNDEGQLGGQDLAQKVRALVRRLSRNGSRLTGDEDPLAVRRAQAIVDSQAFRDAVANKTCRWSVPLLGMVDGVTLDLVADLIYETADGVTLVGFDLRDAEPVERCDRPGDTGNRPDQGGTLALAFLAATSQEPAAVEIVRAVDGHTVRLDDVSASISEARARISGPKQSARP
jgi:hypothetical protein